MTPFATEMSSMNDCVPWTVGLVFVFVISLGRVIHLWTLAGALRDCSAENRAMNPAAVWLNLIPVFRLVYMFDTVRAVARSLRAEFESRGQTVGGDFGQAAGNLQAVLAFFPVLPLRCFAMPSQDHESQISTYRQLLAGARPVWGRRYRQVI